MSEKNSLNSDDDVDVVIVSWASAILESRIECLDMDIANRTIAIDLEGCRSQRSCLRGIIIFADTNRLAERRSAFASKLNGNWCGGCLAPCADDIVAVCIRITRRVAFHVVDILRK